MQLSVSRSTTRRSLEAYLAIRRGGQEARG
jgi:hypothetical protein